MRTPFSEFTVSDAGNYTSDSSALEFESPLVDPGKIESNLTSLDESSIPDFTNPEMEELTGSELKTAVDLNRRYMIDYGWQKYAKDILRLMGMADDSWITNSAEENLKFFTNYFAGWQDRMGYKTSQKGVFGLNNWTYFQKKLGLNSLGNVFNIDVEKAIKANKAYAHYWVNNKSYIFGHLNKGLPLNDEFFAYMIAKFQKDVNPAFNNNIKVDGILGKITWDILRTYIENANPGFDLKQHVKVGDSKTASERYFEARLKYSNLMINALERIQSDVDSIVRNEPIEFNTTRETIYAIVNGIVGAVPVVGAAGNAMLEFNKEYWKNVQDNIDKEFEKNRNLKLNDIIYVLKNHAIDKSSVIVIEHSLEDKLKYSGVKPAKIFSDFTNEIERIMNLNQSTDEILKIALSNLIGVFSPHTRIYIHCRNTTDFKDWSEKDISNLLNDSSRKRLNLRFTAVHPNVTVKENNLTPTVLKNLKALWEVFKKYNFTFKDLKIKKDVFFSINLPLSIGNVISSFKYSLEFSFFLKTLAPGEDWTSIKTILNLPQNVYRLPNNQITYKDDLSSISRSLTDKNNKGMVYESIILEIANSVMHNEYSLPFAAKNVNVISNEVALKINDNSNDQQHETYSNAEIDIIGKDEYYPTVNAENIFTNENNTPANPDYLPVNVNLKATKFNQTQVHKSGIPLPDIMSMLGKNIDLPAIKQKLLAHNQGNPSEPYSIANSNDSVVDSVFTEAIHQFQINNYLNPSEHDGLLGQSTIETLGFFTHSLKSKLSSSGFYGQGQLNRSDIKPQIPSLTNNEFSSANWYQYIMKPAWLGVKISDGIHLLLLRKLREAETWLLAQPQYKGMTAAALGKALGFNANTRYSGARLSSEKQAMHGFGLAIDINVTGNPWIGAGWVRFDKVLLLERTRMLAALKKASGNQSLPGNNVFEYLDSIAKANGNDTAAAYTILKQRNDEFINYLKSNSSELSYWRKSQSFGSREPLNGFLNLHPDLVYALRQIAGLAWGAIDFGPRANGDIMHFDLRTVGIGKLLCGKIGGFVPTAGHPALTTEVFSEEAIREETGEHGFFDESEFHETLETDEHEFHEALENDEHEFHEAPENDEYEMHEASEDEKQEDSHYHEAETKRNSTAYNQGAANIFATITGEKQGAIKGNVIQKGKEGMIAIFAFRHEVTSPRDAASGMATGRRIHKPITITKEVDLASAKLLSALVTNDRLKQVIINFWHPRKSGATGGAGFEINYYRVTLTNAFISNITQDRLPATDANAPIVERVELVYEKIEWQYLEGSNIVTTDDWRQINELELSGETDEAVW